MGLNDKISNAAEKLTGQAKQTAGDATDNEDLQAEGAGQETTADLKQAGEKIKDAFKS